MNYLTCEGLINQCRYYWGRHGLRENLTGHNDWIFVKVGQVESFFASDHIPDSFILFLGDGDYPVDETYRQFVDDSRVRLVFAQNASLVHPKVTPIPIGITDSCNAHGDVALLDKVRSEDNAKSQLLYANYTLHTNPKARTRCLRLTRVKLAATVGPGWDGMGCHQRDTFEGYLRAVSKSAFVISPEGNGIDCHRTWEALYMESIPVVTRSQLAFYCRDVLGFPIVVLSDWSEFRSGDFTLARFNDLWGSFDPWQLSCDSWLGRITAACRMGGAG